MSRQPVAMPFLNEIYYNLKRFIPRPLQLSLRRYFIRRKMASCADVWPIDPRAGRPPEYGCECEPANPAIKDSQACACTSVWPAGKQFAIVITHDVETKGGLNHCMTLAEADERFGFRASFNFVAGEYPIPEALRHNLTKRGFEIGVHGLYHRSNPFRSPSVFQKQAIAINRTLKEWGAVGFRCPSMYHDLDLLHQLDIEYDASTFDTDPFEPQPDGMGTIFPFWVPGRNGQKGYVELPYTLPQDFLLFVILQEKSIDIWKRKLDWIAAQGGMALFITHPEYMSFNGDQGPDKYPARYYEEFLDYIKSRYEGQYWNALPRDAAHFWAENHRDLTPVPSKGKINFTPSYSPSTQVHRPIHACMLAYAFYESDNRVMRYAEALIRRGDSVDVIALAKEGMPRYEEIRGVKVYRIQKRSIDEKGRISYLLKLMSFFLNSLFFITYKHIKSPYELIHVHSVPDFEVFATVFPKLLGVRIILDIHDIVPEFYASKFHESENSILFKALVLMERFSVRYADHVIISNHLWEKILVARSADRDQCSVVMNYPDESLFYPRPRERKDGKFVMLYPGTLGWHQGMDIAIRAFALIKDQAPEAEFYIYGRGPEKENLQRLISELDLQNRVFIKETVPIRQIAKIMSNADVGIIPKLNDKFGGEAFSTKILEFMMLGVPVIASRTKIDQFYFNDTVVKFCKPGDVNDLAQCMLSLIRESGSRETLQKNSQNFIKDYSWQNKEGEYFDIVDSLITRSKFKT